MKGLELGVKEAAMLLGYSEEAVVRLVYCDQLVAEYSGGSLRVSLNSIIRYVGIGAEHVAVRGARRVLEDEAAFKRVFGSSTGTPVMGDFQQFPGGPVGRSLCRAIAISEIRCA